ncbi:acetolactate decarboxylase [Proteus mirabilis]|uniref:acetolactate decarboxylase n=1 Tax=Proteus TaxID=583 RepID=UPI0018C6DD08|nr:acetolactate decarboxylase [Proteus vulgaris]MBG3080608.1 acetolactate decarboxylase [Proteus mirabilis]QPN88787.1 acetolactate decarboxylase [Proteus vulgaris]
MNNNFQSNVRDNSDITHNKNHHCQCGQEIITNLNNYISKHPECTIYQNSLMSSLIAGVYDSDITIADLLKHGDFGLGTFEQLDGELVAFDNNVFQLRSDGSARQALNSQKSPFAVMTFFNCDIEHHFSYGASQKEIHNVINQYVPSDNLFCAIRIEGEFELVKTRTVPRQTPPYLPMLEAIEDQPIFTFHNETGTIAGFRSPQFTQGINVAGFHEHYINQQRQGGGHVLDYYLKQGTLQIGVISRLTIDLPSHSTFLQANLMPDNLHQAIEQAEN